MANFAFHDDPFFLEAEFFWPIQKPDGFLPVRNQGRTHCCYAFAAVDTMYAEQSQREKPLQGSAQELLDCLHVHKPYGKIPTDIPKEGLTNNYENAFQYIMEKGLYTEQQYRYKAEYQGSQVVEMNPNFKIFIEGYTYIPRGGDQDKVINQLREQPLAGCILLTPSFKIWTLTDGVYLGPNEDEVEEMMVAKEKNKMPPFGFHALIVLGFGVDGGVHYLLCQNSFGSSWGHKGYIKVARQTNLLSKRTSAGDKRKRKSMIDTGPLGSEENVGAGGYDTKKPKVR